MEMNSEEKYGRVVSLVLLEERDDTRMPPVEVPANRSNSLRFHKTSFLCSPQELQVLDS